MGMRISTVGARDVHAIANIGLCYISGAWEMRNKKANLKFVKNKL